MRIGGILCGGWLVGCGSLPQPGATVGSGLVGGDSVGQREAWESFDLRKNGLCGVGVSGRLECPNAELLGVVLPEGVFAKVALTGGGGLAGCGLMVSGEVACFDVMPGSRLVDDVPEGIFVDVAGHGRVNAHVCGVRSDGNIVCWGEGELLEESAEELKGGMSSWNDTFCALKADGSLVCWQSTTGGSSDVLEDVPDGVWDSVSVGNDHACALRGDDVRCWGELPEENPPDGPLVSVGCGEWNVCGVRPDASGVCWGSNGYGQLDVPLGKFVEVQPASERVCGLKEDGWLQCWGLSI